MTPKVSSCDPGSPLCSGLRHRCWWNKQLLLWFELSFVFYNWKIFFYFCHWYRHTYSWWFDDNDENNLEVWNKKMSEALRFHFCNKVSIHYLHHPFPPSPTVLLQACPHSIIRFLFLKLHQRDHSANNQSVCDSIEWGRAV